MRDYPISSRAQSMEGRSQQPDWPMTSIAEFQPHNHQFLTGMLALTLLSDRMLCGLRCICRKRCYEANTELILIMLICMA